MLVEEYVQTLVNHSILAISKDIRPTRIYVNENTVKAKPSGAPPQILLGALQRSLYPLADAIDC